MHGHGVNKSGGRKWPVEGHLSATALIVDFSHEEDWSMHTAYDIFNMMPTQTNHG